MSYKLPIKENQDREEGGWLSISHEPQSTCSAPQWAFHSSLPCGHDRSPVWQQCFPASVQRNSSDQIRLFRKRSRKSESLLAVTYHNKIAQHSNSHRNRFGPLGHSRSPA